MVYQEFAPDRELPRVEADWSAEFDDLRQSALHTVGLALTVAGYAWATGQLLMMHPLFFWTPLLLPMSVGMLGTLVLLIRRPLALRVVLFLAGMLGVGVTALLTRRSEAVPFLYIVVIVASTLVSSPGIAFVIAGLSGAILLGIASAYPGLWSVSIISAAIVLYLAAALTAWLTSRNLYTVLVWALRGYERSWSMMRDLQIERGKLSRTMKDLADANLLLKRTTYDLAEAREEAERARQLKSQFAANISHELRTPLHLIVGFSQVMYTAPEAYPGVRWTPELRDDIQEIYESAQHLLGLIDDVLDLSQIEAARLPISKERISLVPLIRDAADTAKGLLRGRPLELRLDLPELMPSLYADPTRIRQVLLNLINNAVRFTERGSITVRAVAYDDEVEVVVEDTGIGIPPDQLADIFTEFHQVDASLRRRYGGTGLGLAICKQFISLHDGRIWVESELGKGSAFHFTLPLPNKSVVASQPSHLPANWRYPAAKPKAPRRLVALTRSGEFVQMLRRHLNPDEVQVTGATDVEEAARLARQSQADAIVVNSDDAEASGGSPPELALAEATGDLLLPVVSLSLPQERQLALAKGFTHCLMKPFTSDQLLQIVAQAAPVAQRILVVDDDPGVIRLVRLALKRARPAVEVRAAYNAPEAIAMLDSTRPDLVLLDIILPQGSGLDVLLALGERDWSKDVPLVAITAYGFQQDYASLGQGLITMRRATRFSAGEVARWLSVLLKEMPARYLAPAEPGPVPASPG